MLIVQVLLVSKGQQHGGRVRPVQPGAEHHHQQNPVRNLQTRVLQGQAGDMLLNYNLANFFRTLAHRELKLTYIWLKYNNVWSC